MGVKLINVSKSFDNELKIKDLSFAFPEIGVVCITGDSGVGKTTLARMICGLDTMYEGEIIGGGIGKCAVAFQEYRLFPNLSALDNVIFASYDKKSPELISNASRLLFELGFAENEVNLKPSQLSGGMKQRVSLARAFFNSAPILILDEATKELDALLKERVLSMISAEAKKRLVILITHNKEETEKLGGELLHLSKPQ